MDFWNLILESNTFNFIFLVIIIAVLMRKLNVAALLDGLREKIVNRIELSKAERERATGVLHDAQNAVLHLDEEIDELKKNTVRNIENAVEQTLKNTSLQVENILKNVETVIENEEKQVSSKLLQETEQKAKLAALEKIREKLQSNPSLHDKYIDEAIEEIGKVAL